MSPARSVKILWITLQMVVAIINSHPESTVAHLRPYVSEFRYAPRYHPSRNLHCDLQWSRRDDSYAGRFEDRFVHRRSAFEEPRVAQNRPWIEIRAVLVRRSKMRKEVEKAPRSTRDCDKKVIISMRINNVGKTNTREKFVLVDHVLDPIKMRKIRLRNPYVVKVRQEPLLHLYGLRFQGIVNAEATEEVINNQGVNFTGCNDGLDNPTCGRTLINGESISQGFCCSCEESREADSAAAVLRHTGSFHSTATAKSNYHRRRDGANGARGNRSESTANLFDNPKAPRQVERGNADRERADVPANGDARRVTSHDISAVNGPLGERASSRQQHRDEKEEKEQEEEEEARGNNSVRRPTQRPSSSTSGGFPWVGDTLSPILRSVFFDTMRTRGKIEAYIDAVHEQAVKERATAGQRADERSEDFFDERDRARDHHRDTIDGSRESSRRITPDRPIVSDDPRPSIHGSPVASDHSPRCPIVRLTRMRDERGFGKTRTGEDEETQNFPDPAKRDRPMNLSESADRKEEEERDRSDGAIRLENTSDYTSPTIHPCRVVAESRIPQWSQFSKRPGRTTHRRGDSALSDNGSGLVATAESLLTASTISFERVSVQSVDRVDIASSPVRLNDIRDVLAPLSKIVITETRRSSIREEERQYGLGTTANLNTSSIESPVNSSAAEIRKDNASGEGRRQRANVSSSRVMADPALTRLRNVSAAGDTRLVELSASRVAARTADKSSTRVRESGTPASAVTWRVAAGNFAKLHENGDSRGIYNSAERTLKAVNLKNNYKFWKPDRRKSRWSKDARKFRGGKNSVHFGKFASAGELRGKRDAAGFKRAGFGAPKHERYLRGRTRRHLQSEEDTQTGSAESASNAKNSRREVQAFVDYYARPAITPLQRETSGNGINEESKNRAISATGRFYGKIRTEENDDAFLDDTNGKRSSVDKRIEDEYVRISNVPKEDSTGCRDISGDFGTVTRSEVAKAEVPPTRDERNTDDPRFAIRGDEITRTAAIIDARRRSNASDVHFFATAESTMTKREVAEPASTRRDDEETSPEPEEKLSAAVVDPPPSSSITRAPDYRVSTQNDRDESGKPKRASDTATTRRTGLFAREFPPGVARDKKVVDHPEIVDDQVGTSSGESEETTELPGAVDNRSEHERGGAKFSEVNNNSSRVIVGYSARPRGPTPFEPVGLSSRGSITESEEGPSRYEERGEDGGSRYVGDALLEDSDGDRRSLRDGESSGTRARRRGNEIAEPVGRVARQYEAYTPTMPSTPTFHEITEAGTSPPAVETTGSRLTTTLATTTEITDRDFRASIRPSKYATTPLSEEIHVEVSLGETILVDETEATTIGRTSVASKQSFRESMTSEGKARGVPSKVANGMQQRDTAGRFSRTKTIDAEEDDRPWCRTTTEMQRTISANGSEPARRAEAGEEKRRDKSEVEYFRNISAAPRFSSHPAISVDRVARSKRSGFIRNSLAFRHDDEERTEKNRQNGRAALNGDVESPDAARPTELRFEIEKRLAGRSDYPANRKFFRRTRERQDEVHEVAVRYIAARDVGLGAIDVIDERCFNSDARERERGNTRDGSTRRKKNLASSLLHYARHDGVGKSDEDFAPAKNRADAIAPVTAKLTAPTKHFSGSPRRGGETEGEEADRHAQVDARVLGARFTAIDGIAAVMRRIAASGARNAGADDLPMIGAETPGGRTSDIGRTRRDRANRNKSRKTPSDGVNVVRGAKLTTASDRGGEARDRAASGRGKKFRSSFDAERATAGGREDARKINGDPADVRARRVPDGGEYPRRSGGQTCGNNIREIISDIKGERSPSTSVTVNEERGSLRASAGSGPVDWHRSARRLLSSGKSNRVALDANDEYYEDDESEADGGSDPDDNKANAGNDDLSGLGDQRDPRGYRDRRKLAAETNRSPGENIDAGEVAGEGSASDDAPAISDNAQAAGERAISGSNEGEITDASGDSEGGMHDVETVRESVDPANINNNDNAPRALFQKNKVYVDRNTADDNTPGQRQSFYESENTPRDPRIDQVVDAESPLSSGDKISEGDLRDESLAVGQPTSTALNAKETVKYIMTNHGRPITGEALRNADLSRDPANDGGIKISLSGRIRVNGVFNQTPMLISFDAVPEERDAATTTILAGDEPLVSVSTSNPSLAAVESAAINHDERNAAAAAAFDLSPFIERANGAAYGSLRATSDGNRAFGETNASEVAMEFFDLARGNERQDEPADRIEERLREEDNAGSRAVSKRVFLADYSSGEMNRTSSRSDVAIDKLDPRSAALNFPDVLGSVLVDDDGDLENWDATTRESQRRVDASPRIGANRSVPRVVPLVRVKIAEPLVDLDENATGAESSGYSDEDSRNAIFDGCYVMPTTIRRLETSAPRGSQTASDQPDDGEPARESTQPGVPETTTSASARLRAAVSAATAVGHSSTTSETPSVEASRGKCDDRADAIRARNMMAIVRFVMKLLRIVAENEEPCPRARVAGGTTIHVKNVIVNGASGSENASYRRDESHVGKSAVDDGTTITSVRTKQNFTTTTTAEWRWTIVERDRAESSPPSTNGTDDTFESFTEAPSDRTVTPALPISSSDRVPENDGLFGTSARTKIYIFASSDAISTSTPKSFLFYEPGRESLRGEHAPRKDTSVHLTGVKEESRLFLNDSGKEAGGTGLGSDYERPNRASSDRGVVDPRLRLGEVRAMNSTRDNDGIEAASHEEEEYPTRDRSDDSAPRYESSLADNRLAPVSSRETGVSRDASSSVGADATRRDRSMHARTISDRRARTARTKLLDSAAKGGTPGEENWIGERRAAAAAAAARSPVDKKLRDGTPGTVAFRRVRETIDRPRDPNLGGDGDGPSVVVKERYADDDGGPRDGKSRERISEGIERGRSYDLVISHSASNEKQDVGENHVFQMGNRVFRKRQKAGMATIRKRKKKAKKKERRKEKKKKSSDRRTRDAWPIRSRRFKRHLLMAPLDQESTYDAGDAAAGLSRRYRIEGQDAVGSPSKFAGVNARRRAAGSNAVDGSEIDAGRAQIRGGQDCADGGHPANIDAAKYLESAHCLRFSDLWYSVYQMERPIIEHAVHLQVYEKRALANGSTYWADLTGVVRLGTFNRHRTSGEDTIAFAYKEVKMPGPQELPNLAVAHDRLLVPSSVTSKGSEYPVEGEAASEYLVVPASSINENGDECDKAGVGFAAFAGQPDRCGRVSGTCLKNQPQAYRRHDAEARAAGRPGCYFLSNFASVPREPIRYNTNGGGGSPREFLALEYHSPHVSAIDIEIRTSYNGALAGGPSGRISKVHVDGTAPDHTVVTVVMTNQRPISAYYRAAIADCPAGLPESWINATFPRKVIPPGRDRTVSLDLYGELPTNEFFCSVQLLNRLGASLATRRIKIRKMDRCSCALHCSCVCVGDGAGCRPMSPELYRAAGFRGPVPAAGRGAVSDATLDALIFVVSLMLLLLLIGFLKWLIGLRVPAVGRWGLDSLLESGGISGYFERELRCRRVVRDEHGAPVHPDTRARTVRICSRKAELFLNTVFFLSFPFVVCCRRLGRAFRPSARKRYSDESKISSTRENPRTICVSTYGDSRDSRMEAEDTEYVMDELKRSEESLRNHSESRLRRAAHLRSRLTQQCERVKFSNAALDETLPNLAEDPVAIKQTFRPAENSEREKWVPRGDGRSVIGRVVMLAPAETHPGESRGGRQRYDAHPHEDDSALATIGRMTEHQARAHLHDLDDSHPHNARRRRSRRDANPTALELPYAKRYSASTLPA